VIPARSRAVCGILRRVRRRNPAGLSRRDLLKAGAVTGAALGLQSLSEPVRQALAAPWRPGRLTDIEHVVFVMQENRSFDHYFGTYPDVRGFADPNAIPGVFQQPFPPNSLLPPTGRILPYHLDTSPSGGGECTPDPTHGWGPQHDSWNGGAMDGWGKAHAGDADWSFMGYYTRSDLPYLHAVADAFTLCDAYHCSVMGSTTSNRLYAMTGMLDPEGKYGGPVESTIEWSPQDRGIFDPAWITYPEVLTDAGVSWKYYATPDGDLEENPLVLFKQYYPGYSTDPALNVRATRLSAGLFGQSFENFLVDAAAGTLPQVSWVLTHVNQEEHPSDAPQDGEATLEAMIDALVANPATWSKTVFFYTHDENGGFFDHVAPPTPPTGTAGEFVGTPARGFDTEPIGLGFRVPMLIVSPFTRGGFVARDTFDHTSQLRFLESWLAARGIRNVTAPNLTAWRRATVGDLTSALNLVRPDRSVPALPLRAPMDPAEHPECATEEESQAPSPKPTSQSMPGQERGRRRSPSGPARSRPRRRQPTGVRKR
jgi:phospholipase C